MRVILPLLLPHSLDKRQLQHQPFRWSLELAMALEKAKCDVGTVLVRSRRSSRCRR